MYARKELSTSARVRGFTIIELMFTLVIVAISVSLAIPSYEAFREKRRLTAAAEDITSYVGYAQSLAIKKGQPVSVSWSGSANHSDNFCIGVSAPPKDADCDCWETDPSAASFCSVDGTPYRLSKSEFVNVGHEFMHFRPATGNFSFGPVRGVVSNWSDAEIVDGDWLMYMHSNDGTDSDRLFGLELSMAISGQVHVCQQVNRRSRLGAYPEC
jgi:prepilin-type N-terminal cleavage/methylation domain-containing protein